MRSIVLELSGERFPLRELKAKVATRNSLLYYRDYLAYDPAKTERPSYFSYENAQLDLRGFFNLAILLMFANNFMLIIENFMQYGFLLKENVALLDIVHQVQHETNGPRLLYRSLRYRLVPRDRVPATKTLGGGQDEQHSSNTSITSRGNPARSSS